MGERSNILALWHRAQSRRERAASAVIVRTEGSSYQKPGARMPVASGGERAGIISGSCLKWQVSQYRLEARDPAAITSASVADFKLRPQSVVFRIARPSCLSLPLLRGEEQPAAALILAAGASRRLGRPKQLLLYRGMPLLRRAVRLAVAAGAAPVLVALDPIRPSFTSALSGLPAAWLPVPSASEGMGASLRAGVEAVQLFYPQVERLLVLVCDQLLVRPEQIRVLLASTPPAAAEYQGKLGVPAVFARSHFSALAALEGDRGARSLLSALPTTAVPLPEAAFDIDTEEDLAALTRKLTVKDQVKS